MTWALLLERRKKDEKEAFSAHFSHYFIAAIWAWFIFVIIVWDFSRIKAYSSWLEGNSKLKWRFLCRICKDYESLKFHLKVLLGRLMKFWSWKLWIINFLVVDSTKGRKKLLHLINFSSSYVQNIWWMKHENVIDMANWWGESAKGGQDELNASKDDDMLMIRMNECVVLVLVSYMAGVSV